jgi:hypothetical protein
MQTTLSAPGTQDAIGVLREDHRLLRAAMTDLALALDKDASAADRQGLVGRIAALLRAHREAEVGLLYPQLRRAGRLSAATEAGLVQAHDQLRERVEALTLGASGSRASQLADVLAQHMARTEAEVLAALRRSGLDLDELGAQMALKRGELLVDHGVD